MTPSRRAFFALTQKPSHVVLPVTQTNGHEFPRARSKLLQRIQCLAGILGMLRIGFLGAPLSLYLQAGQGGLRRRQRSAISDLSGSVDKAQEDGVGKTA